MYKVCILSGSVYPLFGDTGETFLVGGAETQLKTIGIELASRGCEVSYITGEFGQRDREEIGDVTLYKAPLRYMGGSNKYLPADWLRMLRVLAHVDAQIYLMKLPRHLLLLVGLFCRIKGRKLVFIGQKDTDIDVDVVKGQDGKAGYRLYRMGLKLVHAVVAQTEFQQRGFQELFGKRATVIRNALTLEQAEAVDKQGYVLWVGNSTTDKRPELFVELASLLPEHRFVMIMALSPSRPDDGFIRERLVDIPNLDYRGFVPFEEIGRYYREASLFVSTSQAEGFPNTFLQAWQSGTPTVSLEVDPDNVICRHNLGIVSGDFKSLVHDTDRLCNDKVAVESLGSNAVKYAYENHSVAAAGEKYLHLFGALARPVQG